MKYLAALLVVGLVAGCSSDDDPEQPTDTSLLAAIEDALCDSFGPAGSMVLEGRVYDMSDCP